MSDLTLKQCQEQVDDWIKTVGVRYYSELTNLAVLVEEVGEVARLMSRLYGDQSFKPSDEGRELADEFADVLFVLICLANQTGVDLSAAFRAVLGVDDAMWARGRGHALSQALIFIPYYLHTNPLGVAYHLSLIHI